MKKKYEKPELFCESYEFSVNIAGSCGSAAHAFNVNAASYETCSVKVGFDRLFLDNITNTCDIFPEYDGDYGLCYHQPTAANNVFSS